MTPGLGRIQKQNLAFFNLVQSVLANFPAHRRQRSEAYHTYRTVWWRRKLCLFTPKIT